MAQPIYPIDQDYLPGHISFQMENKSGSPVGKECKLPIPLGLNFQEGVNYEIGDLGVIGGTIAAFQNGATLGDLRSVAENMTGQDAKDAVAAQIAGVFGIRGRAGSATVPNPNTSAVFKQVNLREYTFQFKMIPTSYSEYENIKEVVKFFRQNMYPESTHGQVDPEDGNENEVGLVYYGYKHPLSCRIEVYLGGQLQYPLFLPSKIRAVQHQYNASSPAILKEDDNYAFSEVDLSISMVEPKTLEKQMIENGDY